MGWGYGVGIWGSRVEWIYRVANLVERWGSKGRDRYMDSLMWQ